jgi:large subunit ribosomal protein L13
LADIYIDGENAILGRLASYAAKRALEGDNIFIVNSEKVVILGSKKHIFERYWKLKKDIGEVWRGPHYPKMPHMIVKRSIRGMVPRRKARGKEALKRVKAYIGMPEEFESKEFKKVAQFSKKTAKKYITVADLAEHLGWKRG